MTSVRGMVRILSVDEHPILFRGFAIVAGAKPALNLAARALLLAVLIVSSVGRVVALDPSHRISQYAHTSWKIQDGYFGSQPVTIAQTTDGYLWVGTASGVLRFDGVQFVPWASLSGEKLPSSDVHALLGAKDGSLWIATSNGLLQWANQHSVRYLDGKEINSILQDKEGAIWVTISGAGVSFQPICRISVADVRCYGYGKAQGPILASAVGLAQDTSNNLWIGHDTAIVQWNPDATRVYRPEALQSHHGTGGVPALASAADGSIWVGVAVSGHGGGLQHVVNGVMKPLVLPKLNSESLEVSALRIDQQGNLWVGTDNQGIYRIHGTDVDHFGSADGLSSDDVNAMFEDREGDLWCATSNGMDMLRDLRVTTITKREGLSEDTVESVLAARDGTVWMGSNHLQAFVHDGESESISPDLGKALPGNFVTSLLEDHTGRLWAGMNNTLWVHEGGKTNGTFREIKRTDGSAIGLAWGLTEDSEHNIWVKATGTPAKLIRIHDMKVQEEFLPPLIPRSHKLAPDPQSGVWLGLLNGNLARFRSGKTETFTFGNHPDAPVNGLLVTADGSILGATAFGVVGWKNGQQQILSARNGLPCDDIYMLNADNQGDLWLYASCGLIEIPKDEELRWWKEPEATLKMRVFDALDGVQAGQSHFSGSSRGPDGRLWFANNSVVQVVDPVHLSGNTVPPPVYINGIVADRKSYPAQEALKLPALTRDLEIDYTALSFPAPKKVLFRYRLEGRDTKWQEPGTRRQAFYTDLGPGHYRFHVIACNNDGVWNETGASLDFSIAPAYYQTIWFRLCCVAAFLLLLWAAYMFRVRQLESQFVEVMETRVDERTRIARELHDTLLQSFQGAVFQFQAARRLLLRNADNAMGVVDEAIEAAEEGIMEGRAAIHDLRPEPAAQRDLPELLKATGHELADTQQRDGSAPTFNVIVEGKERGLSPMFQDEVYRISREVIRNAFAHADASHIEVEIHYDVDQLRVRIRDDGKGINPEILKAGGQPGHWGVPGIHERAKRIGSRLDFWSETGAGTEVQLAVPAVMAYERVRNGHRFRLFQTGGRR